MASMHNDVQVFVELFETRLPWMTWDGMADIAALAGLPLCTLHVMYCIVEACSVTFACSGEDYVVCQSTFEV